MTTLLFKIDVIMADSEVLAFEDGSASLSGAAGFETKTSLSASGDDYAVRTRVARVLKAKLQFNGTTDPQQFAKVTNFQITMRDLVTKRKCVANKCVFGSLGDVGAGAVDVTFNVLSELQWL